MHTRVYGRNTANGITECSFLYGTPFGLRMVWSSVRGGRSASEVFMFLDHAANAKIQTCWRGFGVRFRAAIFLALLFFLLVQLLAISCFGYLEATAWLA